MYEYIRENAYDERSAYRELQSAGTCVTASSVKRSAEDALS